MDEKIPIQNLPREKDDGNSEYKLKLSTTDNYRIEQITSQMRYRTDEGAGEAIYTLGVTDNGGIVGLTENEYKTSRDILEVVAKKNNYVLSLLSEQKVDEERKMYEFLVREFNPKKYVEIRVACAGSVDAGKTSLLGVLLSGKNDNGRGSARLNVFNYQHEVKSGRTSSVAQHILGFDEKGDVVNYQDYMKSWSEIVKASSKIVTFFDLCGHEKYLKTTITGLTSQIPDLVLILVGGNMGLSKMTKEHMFLCLSLHIPFAIIITKIDICKDRDNVLTDTVNHVKKLLKIPGIRRIPYDVRCDGDVILMAKNAPGLVTVPIFYVSNVTGEGVDYLRKFLNIYCKIHRVMEGPGIPGNKLEYHVDQTFHVAGVGLVLGGQLLKGKIKTGDKLLIGPINNEYHTIQIRSIHCKKVSLLEVESGCYVCLGVKKPELLSVKRGAVLISLHDKPVQITEFLADIAVLKAHSITIKVGYEPVVHTGSIRQTAKVLEIMNKQCGRQTDSTDNVLRTGDRATVRMRFLHHPEYLKIGYRVIFCEGPVKIVGKIVSVVEETVKII